jgi:hypothetical protein
LEAAGDRALGAAGIRALRLAVFADGLALAPCFDIPHEAQGLASTREELARIFDDVRAIAKQRDVDLGAREQPLGAEQPRVRVPVAGAAESIRVAERRHGIARGDDIPLALPLEIQVADLPELLLRRLTQVAEHEA